MYTADRNQILHSGIHCSNLSAAHLYLFSTSFTYQLHNVQRRDCFIPFMGRSFWKRGHGGDICPCPMPSPVGMWCPSAPEEAGLAPDPRAPGLLWGSSWDVCVGVGGGQRCSLAAKEAATARCCSGMHSSADTVALKPFISV